MRKYVKEFAAKIPALKHDERLVIKNALESVDDYEKICDLIEARLEKNPVCPHCSCKKLQKFGKASGLQRYRCKECGRTFNALTGTPLAKLKKRELWLKNLSHMLNSSSLRKIAEELNINLKTAFKWRHRFCRWIKPDTQKKLSGVIEADETYFLRSKKGCRKLNCKPRKRGGRAEKRGISKEHGCVFTAKDRYTHGFEHVAGVGNIKTHWLKKIFLKRMNPEAILITDGARAYRKFSYDCNINHTYVPRNRRCGKGGVFHIQHVNAYHERIKTWINRKFRGVATKYLNHYLYWRHELENKHITGPVELFQAEYKRVQYLNGT